MAFKMTNPFKQKQQLSKAQLLSKEQQSKFSKWIEGSEKAGNVLLDRAKKACAKKGGTWNAEKGECVMPGGLKEFKKITKDVKHGE